MGIACRIPCRDCFERRNAIHKMVRAIRRPAVMAQSVGYGKITRPDDSVIFRDLLERRGFYAHLRRLAFHHQGWNAPPIIRDNVGTAGHSLVLEVHLNSNQSQRIAAIPNEKMQKMRTHPFLRNEAHIFFAYGIEDVSGIFFRPRSDAKRAGRQIQPRKAICSSQSFWITVMSGMVLGRR